MHVRPHSLCVGREEVGLGGLQPRVQHHRAHVVVDPVEVLHGVDVGHVPTAEDVVDVLQEGLTLDLWGWEGGECIKGVC